MKNHKFLFQIITLAFFISFSFTSCELEKDSLEEELVTVEEPILDNGELENLNTNDDVYKESTSRRLTNQSARRYFSGGSQSLHTYKLARSGASIGAYEGIAFSTPVISRGTAYDPNKFATLLFLLHPENKDFIMTTSGTEFRSLRRSGWVNKSYYRSLIQKGPGSGKVPLYRFYSSSNSDHLFTKSYAEGINAGYKYEGIVGYVN